MMNDRVPRCTAAFDPALREAMGAYMLGALEPAESDRVAAHLAECADCRAEYGELAELLPLLASVSEGEAINGPVRPEPAVLGRVLQTTALDGARLLPAQHAPDASTPLRHRGDRRPVPRPRRVRLALASVGALVAAGATAAAMMMTSTGGAPAGSWSATGTAYVDDKTHKIIATVQVEPDSGQGSKIQLHMDQVPAGYTCTMVVVGLGGQETRIGTWTANTDGQFSIPGWSALSPASIHAIEVELPGGDALFDLKHPA